MTPAGLKQLEADLWRSADTLRANSDLKASEYSTPVLGLIFLKFADNKYRQHEQAILAEYTRLKGTRREKPVSEIAIEQCGFYLPDHARYDHLLKLPEEKDIAKSIKEAMKAIEEYKPELQGVLPQDEYFRLTRTDKTLPKRLLKTSPTSRKTPAGNRGEASLQTGPFGTQLKASEYVQEGIPVINVRNIGFGDVRKNDLEYLNEAKAEKLHQHHLRKGDIVFGPKGAVERHVLITDMTQNREVIGRLLVCRKSMRGVQ
jgi:type I restriction-modification system DNA methylase subunit